MRCCFGCVLGGSGGWFLRHFGPDLVDFEGSERSQISSSKLEGEKVVLDTRRGGGREVTEGSGGPNIDR